MSDKVIVTYFLLAILILYMKLGGNDDSMDLLTLVLLCIYIIYYIL